MKKPAKASPAVDKRWFTDKLADNRLTMRKVSLAMGMGADAWHKRLSGLVETRPAEAADMARMLGQPLDEVYRRLGIPTEHDGGAPVPIVGVSDGAGAVAKAREELKPADRPRGLPSGTMALRVQAVNSPLDGWIMFYGSSSTIPPEAVGRLSMVELGDGRRYVRVLQRGYEKGRWNLYGLVDMPAIQDVAVKWAAPILEIRC